MTKGAIDYLFGGMSNAYVIKNPVLDDKKFDTKLYPQIQDDTIRIIQVGNFSERKNTLFTIEILYWLTKMGHKAHLTLLGDDNHAGQPYLVRMREMISKFNVASYVTFLPPDYNVAQAMSASD